jgi:hypothetical protein
MKRLLCCLAVAAVWPTTAALTARACDPSSGVVFQSGYTSGYAYPYQGQRYFSTWGGSGYRSGYWGGGYRRGYWGGYGRGYGRGYWGGYSRGWGGYGRGWGGYGRGWGRR